MGPEARFPPSQEDHCAHPQALGGCAQSLRSRRSHVARGRCHSVYTLRFLHTVTAQCCCCRRRVLSDQESIFPQPWADSDAAMALAGVQSLLGDHDLRSQCELLKLNRMRALLETPWEIQHFKCIYPFRPNHCSARNSYNRSLPKIYVP